MSFTVPCPGCDGCSTDDAHASADAQPMTLVTDLELPQLDHTDAQLRGERFRDAMRKVEGHDGWLAANPFGYTVLDRESGPNPKLEIRNSKQLQAAKFE